MARLLLFAPCEKVIIDKEANTVSLIAALQTVQFNPPGPEEVIPKDPAIPINWDVLTLWGREPGDENALFEQRVALLDEENKVLLEKFMTWQFALADLSHRVVLHIYGMPFEMRASHLTVAGWYRLVGEEQWKQFGNFPLEVVPKV